MCSHHKGSTSAEWSLEVPVYHGPYIGCQIKVMGFSSLTHKERLEHWANRDTRH